MRKIVFAALAAAAVAGAAVARAEPSVTEVELINDSKFTVTSFQSRPAGGGEWTSNRLDRPLQPGERRTVQAPHGSRPCLVDLAINTDVRNFVRFRYAVNICDEREYRLGRDFDPMDAPGMGRGDPGIERGVPLCPGDPRCRGKKK